MPITLITPPTIAALSLPKAASFLRVDSGHEPTEIIDAASAARELFENYTGLSLTTTRWKQSGPYIPCDGLSLDRGPLLSVISVQYIDEANALQAIASTDYYVPHGTKKIFLTEDVSHPETANRQDAIQVTFDAGFGATADDVPANIQQALKLLTQHFFDNRTPVAVGNIVNEIPLGLKHVMDSCREGWLG